jgi:hypothetical protein
MDPVGLHPSLFKLKKSVRLWLVYEEVKWMWAVSVFWG